MVPPALFYHVACMGNWREVLAEQLAMFVEVGLHPRAFVLGSPEDVAEVAGKCEVIGSHQDFQQYETPTLHAAWQWSRENPESLVMYAHTKGVSHVPHEEVRPWRTDLARATLDRRLMGETVVRRWRENVERLAEADILGGTLLREPHLHFDGNFWFAKTNWVASLANPWEHRKDRNDRCHSEPWITGWPERTVRAISMTDPRTKIDDPVEARKASCRQCPFYRQDGDLVWCQAFDDSRSPYHNCSKGKHGRWAARLFSVHPPVCKRWADPDCTCPVCSIPDPLKGGEIQDHIAALHKIRQLDFQPPSHLDGDGVVTYGDGRVWRMLVVAVKMLRRFNSTIPIQVWHVGGVGNELDGLVTLVDVDRMREKHPFHHDRWTIKTWAIAHSGFRRVLFLDADAYCVTDPAPLFSVLDDTNFAYWHDLPGYANRTNYDLLNPEIGGREWAPQVQGGHFLVDCGSPAGWKKLMLARWYDQHANVWWNHQGGEDQGGWRLILTLLGDYQCLGGADWVGVAFDVRWRGASYIVHRCQGKLWGTGEPARDDRLPQEREVMQLLNSLWPETQGRVETVDDYRDRVRSERRAVLSQR